MRVFKKNSRIGRALIEKTGSRKVGNRQADPKSSSDKAEPSRRWARGQLVMIMGGPSKGRVGPIGWIGGSKNGSVRIGVLVDEVMVFIDEADIDTSWKPPRRNAK